MRVFVTGASGFIGLPTVRELVSAGHSVLGLTRSDAGAEALRATGAEVHRGSLDDLESLRSGAAKADGVIHLAFEHDWSNFAASCEKDKVAIETMGEVLAGSDRLLIVSGGTAGIAPGRVLTEDIDAPANPTFPRVSEQAAFALRPKGVKVAVMRLPQVHDTEKQGLVTLLVATAREKGVSAYVGDGLNKWPAAHVSDVARLYRLAMEKGEDGAKYHAVDEEGVTGREIAEALGRGLKVPVVSIAPDKASEHFGMFGMFAGMDLSASSAITRQKLGWKPTGPGMIEDLDNMKYFQN